MSGLTPSGNLVGSTAWAPDGRRGVLAAYVEPGVTGWTHRVASHADPLPMDQPHWSMWLTASEFNAAQKAHRV